jgi:hypothetical protein
VKRYGKLPDGRRVEILAGPWQLNERGVTWLTVIVGNKAIPVEVSTVTDIELEGAEGGLLA